VRIFSAISAFSDLMARSAPTNFSPAYAADVVSPWQRCTQVGSPTLSGNNCKTLGLYIHNARLDYVVTDLTSGVTHTVTTHPINTRYFFGGGFIGDYTDIAVGSDDRFHAFWTDSNNVQSIDWYFGFEWQPAPRFTIRMWLCGPTASNPH